MNRITITDPTMKALFWLRGQGLGVPRHRFKPDYRILERLVRFGAAQCYAPRRQPRIEAWSLTKAGRELVNAIITYEEENPRYSAEEGPSALLHGDTLFSWSHRAAVHEIEDLRRLRQRREERKAKTSGRTGCHETRCRAEPRPKVAICVDDCRNRAGV